MSTIFITQENSGFQYNDAERFGDLVFLTNKEYSASKTSLNNEQIRTQIERGLDKIQKDDYLLMTGNPVMMGYSFYVAAIKLAKQGVTDLNVLRWDNMQGQYLAMSIPLDFTK